LLETGQNATPRRKFFPFLSYLVFSNLWKSFTDHETRVFRQSMVKIWWS